MVTSCLPLPARTRPRRSRVLFRPSRIALSRGAYAALVLADCSPHPLVDRHTRGDWGRLDDDLVRENTRALALGQPVRSLFLLPTGARLLLVTDPSRSVTSILLDPVDHESRPTRSATPNASPRGQLSLFDPVRLRGEIPPSASSQPTHHAAASLRDLLPTTALEALPRAPTSALRGS